MRAGTDFIGTSAGAVTVNREGKIFMAKRGLGARDDIGKWEFPGGDIKIFESREESAKRNIFDKYGMKISIDKILGIYEVIDKKFGDHWISTTFLCKQIEGEPKILYPDKCSDIGWFTLDEIGKLELSRITNLNYQSLTGQDSSFFNQS